MSGRYWFAVAAIGRDRPGIVADLSECVYACDCNLEDTSMTMLGSEFATLMLVSGVGTDVRQTLKNALRRLELERKLTIFLRPLEGPPTPAGIPGNTYLLAAEGIDKAGIVARISRCLARRDIHIADLRSRTTLVPQSGTPVYTLAIRMHLPETAVEGIDDIRRELQVIAKELCVDISITATDD